MKQIVRLINPRDCNVHHWPLGAPVTRPSSKESSTPFTLSFPHKPTNPTRSYTLCALLLCPTYRVTLRFPQSNKRLSETVMKKISIKNIRNEDDRWDQPPGNIANEVLCKSPTSPFGSRVHFGDRRHILSVPRNCTNRSHFSFRLVNPNEAIQNKLPRFDSSGIYFERKVYLYKEVQ